MLPCALWEDAAWLETLAKPDYVIRQITSVTEMLNKGLFGLVHKGIFVKDSCSAGLHVDNQART